MSSLTEDKCLLKLAFIHVIDIIVFSNVKGRVPTYVFKTFFRWPCEIYTSFVF